ncbi:MAG TPA: DUF459 domain-containing protein [Thermoleophilia bacterium]|nr:DUF459 domain-containing protein [Thermoleophilia bacterium]
MQNGGYTRYSPGPETRRRRRQRRARRRLLVLVVVVVVAAAAAFAVLRGGSDSSSRDGGAAAAQKAATAKPTAPPPKVWVASKSDPVRVWVGGDSMGGELGWALGPMLSGAKVFKPTTFYKESSGICRYDFFNWQKEIESAVKSARPQAAVLMMGTNDTQSISQDKGKWIPYGDMAWKQAYEKRVGDIMTALLRGGARRVYWVGMPMMGESWRNSRMRLIDKVFQKQAVKHPGVEYIDVWSLFTKPDGSFDASLRLSDGVHFTADGQQKLGKAVYKAIAADWLPAGSTTAGGSPAASPSASASSP